jgi:hypothetical protein
MLILMSRSSCSSNPLFLLLLFILKLIQVAYYFATYGFYLSAGSAGLASMVAWVVTGDAAGGLF